MSEWKAGDVIAEEGGTIFWVVPTYPEDSRRLMRGIDADGNDWFLNTIEGPTRRLVVLDPESTEDVRRLMSTAVNGTPLRDRIEAVLRMSIDDAKWATLADRLADALREMANPTPPRIDEPTGLGAVVEDSDGRQWARAIDGDAPWCRRDGGARWAGWRYVAAVRVLSEGVVPE